jgi:tellurite resistance protein
VNEVLLAAGGTGLALVLGGLGLVLISRERQRQLASTAIDDTVEQRVPASVQRRQARDVAISQGVRLAAMLSRIDGEVHATELDAIHEFITTHVKKADVPFAARIMRAGLDGLSEVTRQQALDAIVEVADATQRALVFDLLVFVARADGTIHEAERTFLEEVAPVLGVAADEVHRRLDAEGLVPPDEPTA